MDNLMGWLNANASAIQAVAAVVALVVTVVLVLITRAYVDETRKYRRIAGDTLEEIRKQHLSEYDTYVIVDSWSEPNFLPITNIGPGPALNIKVRCNVNMGGHLSSLTGGLVGLPPSGKQRIHMKSRDHLIADIPQPALDRLEVFVECETVFKKPMDTTKITLEKYF